MFDFVLNCSTPMRRIGESGLVCGWLVSFWCGLENSCESEEKIQMCGAGCKSSSAEQETKSRCQSMTFFQYCL